MELKSTQFDMTDPFARPARVAKEVERRLLAMPPARRHAGRKSSPSTCRR